MSKHTKDDAIVAILAGTVWADTDSIAIARAQGIDAGIAAYADAVKVDRERTRPAVVKHVVRDPTGRITAVVEENATIRETP